MISLVQFGIGDHHDIDQIQFWVFLLKQTQVLILYEIYIKAKLQTQNHRIIWVGKDL